MTADVEFRDESGAFGVKIAPGALAQVLESCRRFAPEETGGILVGYYADSLDCAVVTKASERPRDSRSGKTWFVRGTAGLQGLLDGLWRGKERRYYLGEWHFHPDGSPEPSLTDKRQMAKIAGSVSYKCPEPILILAGGSASAGSDVRVYVFTKARNAPIELRTYDEAEGAP